MIEVSVQGKTLEECVEKLKPLMKLFTDDVLVDETRNRLEKQGLEVTIAQAEVPAAPAPEPTPPMAKAQDEETAPKRRGRPPKDPTIIPGNKTMIEATGGTKEPEPVQPKPNGNSMRPDLEVTDIEEQLIAALNAYAASHGGAVAARSVMKNVCGATRLVDCKSEDYPKLLAALRS